MSIRCHSVVLTSLASVATANSEGSMANRLNPVGSKYWGELFGL